MGKAKRLTMKDLAEAVYAMADYLASLPTQESTAEEARQRVLERARELGWEG